MADMSRFRHQLRQEFSGELCFDAATRGRYATDASIYQIVPIGVAFPRNTGDLLAALDAAHSHGTSLLLRGAGTSQNGQTVNESLVLDTTRHMNQILDIDAERRRCVVEPGVVLDELNRHLAPLGLWFPVDVSTASRATIGGMAGNNSCGTRSMRYGTMRDNVISIDAVTADGTSRTFGIVHADDLHNIDANGTALTADLLALGERYKDEISNRFPAVQRRVGGYNIDALVPDDGGNNLSHLLVGSEGTLAISTKLELKLSPVLRSRVLGACQFSSFEEAMDAVRHLVTLNPISVELIDQTMIALSRSIDMFKPKVERLIVGNPAAILLVEFGEDSELENRCRLSKLHELMGNLGFDFSHAGRKWGGVIDITDPLLQASVTEVRQAGLNIMMSMKSAGKPISFVEDCAVPLEHLAEYTTKLTEIFSRHGTNGTWYAHASVGCLHVRPILNLKLDKDVRAMRAIAEEAFDLVSRLKGSHSGEHGDGISRAEFHEKMFGKHILTAFEEIKDRFDPDGVLNPARIVRAPKMDDRRLMRYGPAYQDAKQRPALDWSAWSGSGRGLQGAVEMCNNNGACRNLYAGVMCPSYRVTRDENDVTRGRANTLRLALSGQLGRDGLASDEVADAMRLCVSCKACRRECPTGVDMARMKMEVLAARAARGKLSLRDRLIAYLPRYAPIAAKVPQLVNLRDRAPGLGWVSERLLGLSAQRQLPQWKGSAAIFDAALSDKTIRKGREVVLFADTFNSYFEPENVRAAFDVLSSAGYRVRLASPVGKKQRPLCCGRTFLSSGLVEQARFEARRLVSAMIREVNNNVPIVGLEPSCVLTLRDELPALLPSVEATAVAEHVLLFEEFIARENERGEFELNLKPIARHAKIHGHCHQKSFATLGSLERSLRLVPELNVSTIISSCCGMAGSFGYQSETYDISMKMAEAALLPAVREAEADTIIVANGTSCRQQIEHGADRKALHVANVLQQAIVRF